MLEKYPKANEIIKKLGMEEKLERIKWLDMNRENAAINLAKLLIIKRALQSDTVTLRNMAKKKVDESYKEIGSKIHVFAKEEGRSELGLTNEDVTRIFAHIEIGGNRYGHIRI